MNMDKKYSYDNKWHILEQIGKGGQGTVYKVLNKSKYNLDSLYPKLQKSIEGMIGQPGTGNIASGKYKTKAKDFHAIINQFAQMEKHNNQFALKIINHDKEGELLQQAFLRTELEIQHMSRLNHPNMIRLIDHNVFEHWYVSPYYSKNDLTTIRKEFTGNLYKTLIFLKPLIEGIATLHDSELVHRDIKPENIFIDDNNNPVLGDFGLIYDSIDHIRVTKTYENVGSWEWMPQWVGNKRLVEVTPAFDVFSLGKLIWYLLSGKDYMHLWYFNKKGNDLAEIFPDIKDMVYANRILEQTVVEEEQNCLKDANALLKTINETIDVLENKTDFFLKNTIRKCKTCGKGKYNIYIDTDNDLENQDELQYFGLQHRRGGKFKLYTCDVCGHLQIFFQDANTKLKYWKKFNNEI